MSVDYAGIAAEVSVAFKEVNQGTVTLTRITPGTPDAEEPWVPVEDSTFTYQLDATVKAVEDKFVDGTTIYATDIMVTASAIMTKTMVDGEPVTNEVVALEILPGDVMSIDGKAVSIINPMRTPRAGDAILWKIVVRG